MNLSLIGYTKICISKPPLNVSNEYKLSFNSIL
jgi:hypothetical protein